MSGKNQREIKGIVLFWIAVFASIPLMYLLQYLMGKDSGISLYVILQNWLEILPYSILFCIHHFLLTPFFFKKKYGLYVMAVAAVFFLFVLFILATMFGPPEGASGMAEVPAGSRRPLSPEFLKITIGVLLLLVDLGMRAMVQAAENERRVQQAAAESLAQKLEVLRYQINPHFFMNTLNNIQALVLTEPEKATRCISEFSKLMRMVLDEGHSALIPLERELQFIGHFMALMRLQLPDTVAIGFQRPEEGGDAMVPALALVSFVENAFKHGDKTGAGAFIQVSVSVEGDRVLFSCANQLPAGIVIGSGLEDGLGNRNVRNRLELLYNNDFMLECAAEGNVYRVLLSIPSSPQSQSL